MSHVLKLKAEVQRLLEAHEALKSLTAAKLTLRNGPCKAACDERTASPMCHMVEGAQHIYCVACPIRALVFWAAGAHANCKFAALVLIVPGNLCLRSRECLC